MPTLVDKATNNEGGVSDRRMPPRSHTSTESSTEDDTPDDDLVPSPGHRALMSTLKHTDYAFERILSSGSYSNVWRATDSKTQQRVAVKCITTLPEYRQSVEAADSVSGCDDVEHDGPGVLTEAQALKQLHCHDNIVQLLATPSIKGVCETLVFEFAPGGDLYSALEAVRFDIEMHSQNFLIQVADALEFIHMEGIVHNDLKLENILVFGETAKISDFGLAGRGGDIRIGPALGTQAYAPPELLAVPAGEKYKLDYSGDVFSFGIMIHVVMFGKA